MTNPSIALAIQGGTDEADILAELRRLADALPHGSLPRAYIETAIEQNRRLLLRAGAAEQRERVAVDAYQRQQGAQREQEALYMAAVERAAEAERERDAAVRSVAALFHAYIAITPGETVEGLEPRVAAQADALLQELSDLQDHYAESIEQVAWARGLAESYIAERDRRTAERDAALARATEAEARYAGAHAARSAWRAVVEAAGEWEEAQRLYVGMFEASDDAGAVTRAEHRLNRAEAALRVALATLATGGKS